MNFDVQFAGGGKDVAHQSVSIRSFCVLSSGLPPIDPLVKALTVVGC